MIESMKKFVIRREKLRDGTVRVIYVPGGEDRKVYEVIRVEILDSEGTVRKLDSGEITIVSPEKIKDYQGEDVIYNYLGKEDDVLIES